MINRLGIPILVGAAQVGAAALALGRPDPGPALTFLGGGWPTAGDTLAALELLVWAIVLGAVGWSLVTVCGELAGPGVPGTSRWRGADFPGWGWPRAREGVALAIGALILVAGAAHHVTGSVGMSGGSVQEAQAFLGR